MIRTTFRRLSCRHSLILLLAMALVPTVGFGKEVPVTPAAGKPEKKVPFSLNQVVDARVAKMAVPEPRPDMVGIKMSISSPSPKAREHVQQGLALVHAQWDFEAYRHFCAALVEDEDCLMAYCGVALALAKPYSEYSEYRRVAVERMLDLLDADDKAVAEGKAGRYPMVEKKFVLATAALSTSPRTAGALFHKVAEEYPQAIQARLLSVFMTRGGYDVLGNPSLEQDFAIKKTRELLKLHPDNPMVLGFWLALNAEVPNQAMDIKKEILPYARQLVKKCPRVPSWQHTLGHFEWRAGNYLLAERAFTRAAELYAEWMKREGVGPNDCEGYIRAKCYLANTLYQRGDFPSAMRVAKEIRAMKLDPERPRSPGNQILLWCGYTLPARLYAAHGADGDLNRALESFPSKEALAPYAAHAKYPTLAGVYVEALSAYIGSRKAIAAQDLTAAKTLRDVTFRSRIVSMAKVAEGAMRSSDYSHYFNAGSSLAIYDMELAGLIALNGPEDMRMAASNWFRSARDKQGIPSLMMPPAVISPMENRLAEYYLRTGDNAAAYEAYQEGLKRYPNNMSSLLGAKRCLELLGKKEDAARVQKHIELVRKR
ncbi:MAG: tetratricopeptide repeat protein [Akkermansiaceae bacterium]|nr:tetratricopeptide repeat protein [Akkermansiaceae bacterium]